MLNFLAVGIERYPPLLNPILAPITGRGPDKEPPAEAKPVLPVNRANNDDRPARDGSQERLFKLTAETRRELLLLQEDLPFGGPRQRIERL